VPDWPTTYGHNLFTFPPSLWVGGIFYEHVHRLAAATVGLLTLVLAAWLWRREARGWLRWLGMSAVILIILQGVLGGLRVTLLKDQMGLFHAALAQIFLAATSLIALATSSWWTAPRADAPVVGASGRRLPAVLAATLLIFLQTILGAGMRHQHAGLAVPDFPLAYGALWPSRDAPALARINRQRAATTDWAPVTAPQIAWHLAHRATAILVVLAVALARRAVGRPSEGGPGATGLARLWLVLVLAQFGLGAATIWTQKNPLAATAHVMVGALTFTVGAMLALVLFRQRRAALAARHPALAEPSRSGLVFANSLAASPAKNPGVS
jgi:heme a synthase